MTAYAVANLTDVRMGPEIVAYLEGIDATLAPYDGYFVIHGGPKTDLEGTWTGDLVAIAFPDMAKARDWYRSDAYRKILPLRCDHSSGDVILIDGVDRDHKATDILHQPQETGSIG